MKVQSMNQANYRPQFASKTIISIPRTCFDNPYDFAAAEATVNKLLSQYQKKSQTLIQKIFGQDKQAIAVMEQPLLPTIYKTFIKAGGEPEKFDLQKISNAFGFKTPPTNSKNFSFLVISGEDYGAIGNPFTPKRMFRALSARFEPKLNESELQSNLKAMVSTNDYLGNHFQLIKAQPDTNHVMLKNMNNLQNIFASALAG